MKTDEGKGQGHEVSKPALSKKLMKFVYVVCMSSVTENEISKSSVLLSV